MPIFFFLCLLNSCVLEKKPSQDLPFLGQPTVTRISTSGIEKDTLLQHRIPEFELTNQYEKPFGSDDLKNKVYLTEFFFTSCPSVCPKVAKQMDAIHEDLATNENFALVSFTLDSKRDTPTRLYDFAQKKKVNHSNWFFLSGARDKVYDLAEEGYYVAAYEDTTRIADDNIMHDGILVLVDQAGHIRGMYDGKEKATVNRVKADVEKLLN